MEPPRCPSLFDNRPFLLIRFNRMIETPVVELRQSGSDNVLPPKTQISG